MAQTCTVCGKTSMRSVRRKLLRGHYNPTGIKRKYPNLQWIRLPSGKRVKACTACRKTAYKSR